MSVNIIEDREVWDRFVEDSDYGLIFHKWDFLRIIERHSGYKLLPLAIYRGAEPVCLFPIFFKNMNGLRMVFSPPPGMCIPYLGPILSKRYDGFRQRKKENYMDGIMEEVERTVAMFSSNYVSFSTVPKFGDIRGFKWNGYDAGLNYTYVIGLEQDEGKILGGFDTSCRKAIKECSNMGLVNEQVEDADMFYRIMKERFVSQGMKCPLVSPQYIHDIMNAFPENVKMYFLYRGDDIACVTLNTEYKKRIMFWIGEVNLLKDVAGNEYQKWELIKKARSEGFKEAELEGAGIKQLSLYKSKFNPSLEISFLLSKKDTIGRMAEWAYIKIGKKA